MAKKLKGTIERKFTDKHTFVILASDGYRYVAYRQALDSFGTSWEDLRPGMLCEFIPAEDARRNHDNRAVEVRITDPTILDGI
ncbi:MAG: hypothetical protein ACRD3J_14625 [Thermoanaerobaculia bacterium]